MVQFIVVSEGYFKIALALHWNAFRFNSGKFPITGFNQKQIPPFARFLLLFNDTFWLDHLTFCAWCDWPKCQPSFYELTKQRFW